MMTKIEVNENKSIIRQFIEQVINTGDLEAMAKFVAEDIVDHNSPPDAPQGIEAYRQHLAAVRHTYSNFHLAVEAQIAEGDGVVTRVTATGIHQNEWLGLKPSGRQITLTGINIDRVIDDRIVEHWGEANTLGALFQMGAKIVPAGTE
jgi:predicted ester cyclase